MVSGTPTVGPEPSIPTIERAGLTAGVLGGWGATCVMRGLVPTGTLAVFWTGAALAFAGFLLVLASWILAWIRPVRSSA